MLLPSLSPAIERLSADGHFGQAYGDAGRGPAVALLPREICAFERFEPGGSTGSAALTAARLHAGQASPFLRAGALVRRESRGFAIWWWDLDAVERPLRERFGEAPPRMLPISLAHPAGDGWRIVRLEPGYEAQLWRDGALLASTWRSEPFDQAAWTAFVRVQRDPDAPETPPTATPLPLVPSRVAAALARELTRQEIAATAVAVVAGLLVLTTAFLVGQGLRLGDQTRALTAEAALIAPARPTAAGGDMQRLAAWRALSQRPDAVTALARAIGVVELYGATPTAWAADTRQVTLTIPYTAISSLNRIAVELKGTGLFSEIRPTTDTERGVIELRLALVGAAPVSPGE